MITYKQLRSIITNAIFVKMFMTFPHQLIRAAGNAAWQSVAVYGAAAAGLFWISAMMFRSNTNIIEVAGKRGGRAARVAVGGAVLLVAAFNLMPIMRIFPEIIRLVLLRQTYIEFIWLVFAVVVVCGAYCGIESIAAVHELYIPVAGGAFILLMLLLLPKYNIDNIFPIFGTGLYNVYVNNSSYLSVFSDLLLLNILIPRMEYAGDYRKIGLTAILVGGGAAFLIVAAYCLVYSYPASGRFLIPSYQIERVISLSSFFSHFEAIFQFMWSVAIILYCAFSVAVMSETVKASFGSTAARHRAASFCGGDTAANAVGYDKLGSGDKQVAVYSVFCAAYIGRYCFT